MVSYGGCSLLSEHVDCGLLVKFYAASWLLEGRIEKFLDTVLLELQLERRGHLTEKCACVPRVRLQVHEELADQLTDIAVNAVSQQDVHLYMA